MDSPTKADNFLFRLKYLHITMITHKSGVAARSIGPVFKLTSVAIGKKTTALIFGLHSFYAKTSFSVLNFD